MLDIRIDDCKKIRYLALPHTFMKENMFLGRWFLVEKYCKLFLKLTGQSIYNSDLPLKKTQNKIVVL